MFSPMDSRVSLWISMACCKKWNTLHCIAAQQRRHLFESLTVSQARCLDKCNRCARIWEFQMIRVRFHLFILCYFIEISPISMQAIFEELVALIHPRASNATQLGWHGTAVSRFWGSSLVPRSFAQSGAAMLARCSMQQRKSVKHQFPTNHANRQAQISTIRCWDLPFND